MGEKAIFIEALRKPDDVARAEYLDRVCGASTPLRCRLEGLLHEHERLGSFIESPAPGISPAVAVADATMPSGDTEAVIPDQLENRVLGDYRILREIGRGGMGVVYEAEQISLGRTVALKTLPYAAMLDKTRLTRFKNEARAAASLEHPNVVHVHSVGAERGVHYYAMQFIDGRTVADLIAAEQAERRMNADSNLDESPGLSGNEPTEVVRDSESVPARGPEALNDTTRVRGPNTTRTARCDEQARIRSVVELAIQAAEALEHAHRMGIVHRDIKPSNLLVDADQHLWVTDFGLALVEAEGNLTASGGMLGTLRYMSPEQLRGDRHVLDHHTDIYSLGVTLYEMLVLRPAFPDSEVTKLVRRIPHEEPVAPRKLNPSIPRDLATIVLKAMAKEPVDRYTTARDFADDLRRFLCDEPIQARSPTAVQRTTKWARRHRSVLTAAAAAFFIAAAMASVLLWEERSETFAALERETVQRQLAEQHQASAVAVQELAEKRLKQSRADFARALKALDTIVEEASSTEFAQLPGVAPVREKILQQSLTFYKEIIADHDNDPYARQQHAQAQLRIARICATLHQWEDALQSINRSIEILEGLAAEDPTQAWCKWLLASCLFNRRHNLMRSPDEQLADAERGLEIMRQLLATDATLDVSAVALFQLKVAELLPPDSQRARDLVEESVRLMELHQLPPLPGSMIWLAKRARRTGDYEAAVSLYRRGIQRFEEIGANPEKPDNHIERWLASTDTAKLAEVFEQMGRMEEAEASYRRAVEMMETLCDELPAFHSYREEFVDRIRDLIRFRPDLRTTETLVTRHPGDIRLHELHAEQLAKSRQPLAALTTAIERFPGQIAYYSYRAEILEALGRQEETRLDLDQAIALLSPDGDAQAYVTRGELFTRAGQFDRANDDFREAFAQSIDDYELADSVAQVSRRLTGKGQFEQALAIARLVLEDAAQPHWQAHVAVCEAQIGLQRYDEALDQITMAIEKAPRQWWLYKRRADARFKLGRFEEALADLTTALELDPSDMSIILWIAPERVAACPSPEFRAGMRRLADRAVDLNNESIEPLVTRARLAAGFGDWNQAKTDLKAALEQKPDSGRANNQLAWFLVTAREPSLLDPRRAVTLATRAVERKPENPTYWNTLGVAQYRAGDYAAAVESLTRAVQLSRGEHAYNYLFLAMSHWQLGNPEQARPWYDKSVQWISDRDVANEELLRFQKEAESLLGVAPAEPKPDASH